MNNVLANIESQVSPAALAEGTKTALTTGHINHGLALFSAFVVDSEKEGIHRVDVIKGMAVDSGLSFAEFSAQCRKAQEIADAADLGNGFVKPSAGTKGQDAYGPKRRLMNSRIGEAKNLFGVFKQDPKVLAELGYWAAVAKARDYLKTKGVRWNLATIEAPEVRDERRERKLNLDAVQKAMAENPMQAGESRKEYLERLDSIAQIAIDEAQEEAFNKGVKTLYDALLKKHGANMLVGVMQMVLDGMDNEALESLHHWIGEELVIRTMDDIAIEKHEEQVQTIENA